MENKFLLSDNLLWDYADGFLPEPDRANVEAFLKQHPQWQERLHLIQEERAALLALPLEKPNAGFTDRVMAAWTAEIIQSKTAKPGRDWVLLLIAGAFGLFILAPITALIANAASVHTQDLMPTVDLPAINWSSFFGGSIFHYGAYLVISLLALKFVEQFLANKILMDKLGAKNG